MPNCPANQQGRRVVLSVVVACATLIAGCGSPAPDDSQARAVVDTFLQQLHSGEIDAAWESTTADFKSDEGRDSFRLYVQDRQFLSGPLNFEESRQIEIHGLTRWEAVLQSSGDSETAAATIRIMIALENDIWKVDRLVVE